MAFTLKAADWEHINNMQAIISDANAIQQYFSAEQHPTLWCIVPALEELQTSWEVKQNDLKYRPYHSAIGCGLAKIRKYYNKLDDKPVYILALSRFNLILMHFYFDRLDSSPSILQVGLH